MKDMKDPLDEFLYKNKPELRESDISHKARNWRCIQSRVDEYGEKQSVRSSRPWTLMFAALCTLVFMFFSYSMREQKVPNITQNQELGEFLYSVLDDFSDDANTEGEFYF